jgi:2-polyprenyl-3-methyl-5-hydroxy-6-metoxy-1,4-benzoquinol methylase
VVCGTGRVSIRLAEEGVPVVGTDIPMKMIWHHLAFNEEGQIEFGEYTFEMHEGYHGIVVVKIKAGVVKH